MGISRDKYCHLQLNTNFLIEGIIRFTCFVMKSDGRVMSRLDKQYRDDPYSCNKTVLKSIIHHLLNDWQNLNLKNELKSRLSYHSSLNSVSPLSIKL